MKNLIFISHVTPLNNYQAAWLEAKLTLLGYKVWVDIKDLRGGDSFWPEIQSKIQNHTVKFLPIVTKDYIDKANTPRTGVRKEISCADAVRDMERFIIPLRFDESPFMQFPIEFQEMNSFDFSANWAEGLAKLVKELEKSDVPKVNNGDNYIKKWFEALDIKNEVIESEERYYTNWLEFKLPNKIYVHQMNNINETALNQVGYPYIVESTFVITFAKEEFQAAKLNLIKTYEYEIGDFKRRDDIFVGLYFVLVEPNKKLVKLLNQTLIVFLKANGLNFYTQTGNKEIFYFPIKEGDKKKISLKVFGRSNKAISGRSVDIKWHYAVSGTARLFPVNHFKISHHLYFEKEGQPLDKEGQQNRRRSVASGWYNKDWLDMLLAYFQMLKNDMSTNQVIIPLSRTTQLELNCEPLKLISSHGYIEPNKVELEQHDISEEDSNGE